MIRQTVFAVSLDDARCHRGKIEISHGDIKPLLDGYRFAMRHEMIDYMRRHALLFLRNHQ